MEDRRTEEPGGHTGAIPHDMQDQQTGNIPRMDAAFRRRLDRARARVRSAEEPEDPQGGPGDADPDADGDEGDGTADRRSQGPGGD